MKIAIFSNYLNGHQLPFVLALAAMDDVELSFVAVVAGGGNVGRYNLDAEYPFVLRAYNGEVEADEAMRHAVEDDIVVFQHMGGHEEYVRARAKTDRPFFRATERLLKRGAWWRWAPPKIYRTWNWFTRYKHAQMRVLCLGGFVADDLASFGYPTDNCLKWAYFPYVDSSSFEVRSGLLPRDKSLCSAQRLIPLKRVDLQVRLAKSLKDAGLQFHLDIAGDGPEREKLEALATELGVSSQVSFRGALSREETDALMGNCDVFLATSNRKEGWGCTVNEALAHGCALVASDAMGSVPFLVENGINGFDFKSECLDDLCEKVTALLGAPDQLARVSDNAVATMRDIWNAQVAAERFVAYSKAWLQDDFIEYASGPMSPCVVGERK